jgi:hypothetical protein
MVANSDSKLLDPEEELGIGLKELGDLKELRELNGEQSA